MPNAYATLTELKRNAPQNITSTDYDVTLYNLLATVSRWIDNECKRTFYPQLRTRYFDGSGTARLRVPDLLTITSVSYSNDDGLTYTAYASTDYIATVEGDYNSPHSYTQLVLDANGDFGAWHTGQRSIKIVGVWAYTDDRDTAWESSGDTTEDNPLSSSAVTMTVNSVSGGTLATVPDRFQPGQLLRCESEYIETTLARDVTANTVGVLRGRNGTTAAAHAQNTALDIWRPPDGIRQACIIQAVRQLERGQQHFGDARAQPEVGQLFWFKSWDPEAQTLLRYYSILEPA